VELPPVPEPDAMVALGVRVPPGLAERVRKAADEEGVPYSQLVRNWIEMGLTERMTGDQTVSLSVLRRLIAHAAQGTQAA
jgi:predicted DNA-binding protein